MLENDRPQISIYIAASIDGYIARKDGSIDWLNSVQGYEEDYGFHQFFDSIDCLIIGKNTYEIIMNFDPWPYQGKRVIVLSHFLKSVKEEAELFQGDLNSLINQLHSEGVKHIWVDGGIVISQFLRLKMVDQMIISVIPILLGSGIPLFKPIEEEIHFHLQSSQSYTSGLVQLRYSFVKNKPLA